MPNLNLDSKTNSLSTIHRISYDPEANAMHIRLTDQSVFETDDVRPDVLVDYTQDGQIVGIEILHVSRNQTLINKLLFNSPLLYTWHTYSPSILLKQLEVETLT